MRTWTVFVCLQIVLLWKKWPPLINYNFVYFTCSHFQRLANRKSSVLKHSTSNWNWFIPVATVDETVSIGSSRLEAELTGNGMLVLCNFVHRYFTCFPRFQLPLLPSLFYRVVRFCILLHKDIDLIWYFFGGGDTLISLQITELKLYSSRLSHQIIKRVLNGNSNRIKCFKYVIIARNFTVHTYK